MGGTKEKKALSATRGSGEGERGREAGDGNALVIVESPAKAKTIAKYLGPGYVVESSVGHIRDLPSTAAEIPAEIKKEPWARIGVNVNDKFKPVYVIPAKKKAQVSKLASLCKKAKKLYLATDEDREGEAIAWHLVETLKPKVPVKRMVFDEITKSAIQAALEQPRDLDMQLVNAQEARRILDRLYGYEVSPVLWRKVGPKLSSGRVQSVATRLIVARERERMRFVTGEYWDVEALLQTRKPGEQSISSRLLELGGRRVALGKDFDNQTGRLRSDADAVLLDKSVATAVAELARSGEFTVSEISEKPFTQRAYPPFITSTLQQEASRKLRFAAHRTMRLAQSLYENGYITYMRTDSTNLSGQAINAARKQVVELYGAQYLPDHPRTYTKKAKGAQEAHEAIRPAGEVFRTPREVESELDADAFRLYEMIWKRTVACQMKDAVGRRTHVRITLPAGERGQAVFATSGKVITFPGFLLAYVEGADDPQAELEGQERVLPPLTVGQTLAATQVDALQHTTTPPARYTEASLIKELEDRGIGRPSTYASIIQIIQDRGYVWKKGTALVPTFTAFAVINLLERHFADLVDFDFTAKMEDDLDGIAGGQIESIPWLHAFYFGDVAVPNGNDDLAHVGLKRRIGSDWEKIDARELSTIPLGTDEDGQAVVVRIGKYGPYVQAGEEGKRANIPDDIAPDEMTLTRAKELLRQASSSDTVLGQDPQSGKPIYLKQGRFGPYIQLGDPERTEKGNLKRGGKPKMVSLWPTMTPETVTLDDALLLLSFPRTVGVHPQLSQPITVQDGKFGPYLKCGRETRSLSGHEQLVSLTMEQAIELLTQPKGGQKAGKPQTLIELGAHPQSGAALQVKDGRFGPYVTDGVVNASLPKGTPPQSMTVEKALELIAAREERMRAQGKDPRAPKKARGSRSSGGKKKTTGK